MDLKRLLVFFVLVFFILSTNIYSSSIFGIENITSLPYGAENNDFIIGYSSSTENIFIAIYKSSFEVESFHLTEEGVYDESGNLLRMFYSNYIPDENRWSPVEIFDTNVSWLTEQGGLEPLYSSKDVYHNGQIYIFGKKYDGNLGIFSNLTSSIIFSNLLKPLLKLMPFILTFIVLIFVFLKAWNFIKGVF